MIKKWPLCFFKFLIQSVLNCYYFYVKVRQMLAQIQVTFKEGVLDPQGKTVHHALNDLGYDEVLDVHIGKYLEVKLDSVSEEEAEVRVREMSERLLANTVIESFHFKLVSTE